ncbi:MAG: glycosyltransferase family 4 protein [Chloroflexi bacterium]|nr:glycosyltransferase family 4 protein [Chloroflexota bacterium]
MLIGIDASRATGAAPTGTEVYSRELIRSLLAADRENAYRLYTRDHVARDYFGAGSTYSIELLRPRRLWTHLGLSAEVLRHPPDVLFVPAHVLPLAHPRRSVVTIHDLGQRYFPESYPSLQRLYHDWAARWNARNAARLFADSDSTRDDVMRMYGVEGGRISVVYPAYDSEQYRPSSLDEQMRAREWLRIGKDYILALGTVHPRKNYARLIEAFAALDRPDLCLVVAGRRGWMYEPILERGRSLGIADRVLFLEYVPSDVLPFLVGGAKLLAFPSLYEGFGLPVLEAQGCGTPVVCSMTSSLPEVAGDAALFVDPLDVDAIAGAMERLLSDASLRAKLVSHGFENIKRFSWERSARSALEVFRCLQRDS